MFAADILSFFVFRVSMPGNCFGVLSRVLLSFLLTFIVRVFLFLFIRMITCRKIGSVAVAFEFAFVYRMYMWH